MWEGGDVSGTGPNIEFPTDRRKGQARAALVRAPGLLSVPEAGT